MSSLSSERCASSEAGSPVSMNGNIVAPVPSVGLFWLLSTWERPREWPNSWVAVAWRSTDRGLVSTSASATVKRKPLLALTLNWTSTSRIVPAL